ncbi:hypothetical protein M0802_006999 [Mischocyttarus mexicanus]|nr:hypothetical protein M0802_006999 [Mischocyttarus mexicanus]
MSLAVEARARINGTSDIYVKTGSLLTLTCLMSQGPHHLGTVAWYRGNQAVVTSPRLENDVNAEPRISVETEWSDALTSSINNNNTKNRYDDNDDDDDKNDNLSFAGKG